jgi:hypothetical protein
LGHSYPRTGCTFCTRPFAAIGLADGHPRTTGAFRTWKGGITHARHRADHLAMVTTFTIHNHNTNITKMQLGYLT